MIKILKKINIKKINNLYIKMSSIKEDYNIIKINENQYFNKNGEKIIEKIIFVKEDNKWLGQKKYYENNREKINEHIKNYRKDKYQNDEEYRNKVLARKREIYKNKKNLNL